MKTKQVIQSAVFFIVLIGGTCLAAYRSTGHGKAVTATTTPQSIAVPDGDYAWRASVAVVDDGRAYVMKNCSTNDFVLTNAVPIEAYPPVTFDGVPVSQTITNLVIATQSSTAEVFVQFD